jgi:glycosyltransferase involved in cell wall biosynthesis
MRVEVQALCQEFPFVCLTFHDGKNVAAARNVCARSANEDLIINVDDDVYVQRDAIALIVDAYDRGAGPRVIAGSVAWDSVWSEPVVVRSIGYGRAAKEGEAPSFLVGAFFIYPRQFALTWPWNENIRTSDDVFMGALWRSHNIALLFEPLARALHDSQHTVYNARDQHDLIYANLYDALIANPNLLHALTYQIFGFLLGLKLYARPPNQIKLFVSAWLSGNTAFIKDWTMLRALTSRPIAPMN